MSEEQRKQQMQQLRHLIKDYKTAILTTVSPEGWPRSRPMITEQKEHGPALWFATAYDTDKVHDIEHNPRVGVTYYHESEQFYVSVSGTGEIVRDPQRIRQIWDPGWLSWFPNGPDDPNMALVAVHAEHVEYWDERSGRVAVLFSTAKRGAAEARERRVGEKEHHQH